MNEQITFKEKYTLLSKYSMIMSVAGMTSCLIAFPSGIYYGFVLGVTGAAGGFLSRTYSLRKGTSAAAIIIGLIDAGICLLSFHGLNTLYSSLNDPVLGPEITEFVLGILRQYGVSPEVFVSVMQP